VILISSVSWSTTWIKRSKYSKPCCLPYRAPLHSPWILLTNYWLPTLLRMFLLYVSSGPLSRHPVMRNASRQHSWLFVSSTRRMCYVWHMFIHLWLWVSIHLNRLMFESNVMVVRWCGVLCAKYWYLCSLLWGRIRPLWSRLAFLDETCWKKHLVIYGMQCITARVIPHSLVRMNQLGREMLSDCVSLVTLASPLHKLNQILQWVLSWAPYRNVIPEYIRPSNNLIFIISAVIYDDLAPPRFYPHDLHRKNIYKHCSTLSI
jgi:hypothetical protein